MSETPSLFVPLRLAAALLAAQALGACGPGENSVTWRITFALSDFPDEIDGLGRLSFEVTYDGGQFVGNGQDADCELLDDDDRTATFSDDDADTLEVEIMALDNALGDEDDEDPEIVECRFIAEQQPSSENFEFTVTLARDEGNVPVDVDDVDIVVSGIDEIEVDDGE